MGFGIREGRRQAKENLSSNDDGECARCGGNSAPSSIPGYLQCVKCAYEWSDPDAEGFASGPRDSISRDSEKLEEFKNEMASGQGLARDDDDNLLETQVGAIHISDNVFDGGEEIRIEYPGMGTEFYIINEDDALGWKRGRDLMQTARNIASIINRTSQLVHASAEGTSVSIELRDVNLDPDSLVIFVDDPGGRNMTVERLGVILDPDDVQVYQDYHEVVKIVLADGIITPSEDELLWAMRQNLGITDQDHVRIVIDIFGEDAVKECTICGINAPLFSDRGGWWCEGCQEWV